MAVQVPVEILLSIDKAIKESTEASNAIVKQLGAIDKAAEETGGAFEGMSLGFAAVAAAALAAGAVIVGVLSKSIKEATEADDAFQSMKAALDLVGAGADSDVQAFQDLATEIARTTRFSDDAVIAQVRLGKQFGLTNAETAKLIKAGAELAAATRTDLGTAVEQLGKTFDGTVGRLAETVPALRGLSKEALISGGALDLVLKRFGGSATRDLETFSGALEQTKNSFGDIFENIGKAFVENDAFIAVIRELGDVFKIVAEAIAQSDGSMKDFVTGSLQLAIELFGTFVGVIRSVDEFLRGFIPLLTVVAEFLNIVGGVIKSFATLDFKSMDPRGLATRVRETLEAENKENAKRDKFYEQLEDRAIKISNAITRASEKQRDLTKSAEGTVSAFSRQNISVERQTALEKERVEQQKKMTEELEKQTKILDEQFRKQQEALRANTQNPFAGLLGEGRSGTQNILGADARTQDTVSRIAGGISAALQGRQGATNLLAQGAELAGQAFLGVPGIGQVFSLLAQGPEQVKLMVKQFADAIPDIIVAVAESIPVVFEALAEKLPDIITKLVEKAPDIAIALAKAMPLAAIALGKAIVNAGAQFSREVLAGAVSFVGEIIAGAGRFIQELIKGIGNFGDNLTGNIKNPLNGQGIGTSIIGSVPGLNLLDGVSLNDFIPGGGFLPQIGGNWFKTSGGGFSKTATGPSGASMSPIQVNLQVGQRQFASAMLDVNRQGFRTS